MDREETFGIKIRMRASIMGKRIMDLVGSALLLIFLSPVFGIVAIYIKRSSPGPVFYRGPRVGRYGKLFHILKFRTMHESPESYTGPRITANDDERITASGRWLRDTKLNELPQLWNVFVGEMSLVGPRPEDPELVAAWPEFARDEILSVRPGITSPASVLFRDEERSLDADTVMEKYLKMIAPSKIRLDQIYVREHTLIGDLDTLFLTIIALLPKLRDQPIPEHLLIWGPLSRLFYLHLNWFFKDVPIAFIAVIISGFFWRSIGPLNLGIGRVGLLAIGIALLFGIFNAILGMNGVIWSQARPSDAWGLAFSDLIVAGILKGIEIFQPASLRIPDGMLVLTSILAFFGFMIARYRLRLLTGLATRWLQWRGEATYLGERVLVIGAGEMAQITLLLLRQNGFKKAYTVVGLVDDNPRKRGVTIDGCKVLGTTQELPQLIAKKNIGAILFSIGKIEPEQRHAILDLCHKTGVRVVLIPNILELLSACLFAPHTLLHSDLVSPEWDGRVPVQVIISWLTELEALAPPENTELVSRLNKLRDALVIDRLGESS